MMNRKLRRELSKRKWLSRAKKVYNICGRFFVPVKGIKAIVKYDRPACENKDLKQCESITEFLDSSKYAKILKKRSPSYKMKMEKYYYKMENRKDRHKNKVKIQDSLQEQENMYKEDCSSCIHYDRGLCEKGLLMTDNCSEYWD